MCVCLYTPRVYIRVYIIFNIKFNTYIFNINIFYIKCIYNINLCIPGFIECSKRQMVLIFIYLLFFLFYFEKAAIVTV